MRLDVKSDRSTTYAEVQLIWSTKGTLDTVSVQWKFPKKKKKKNLQNERSSPHKTLSQLVFLFWANRLAAIHSFTKQKTAHCCIVEVFICLDPV